MPISLCVFACVCLFVCVCVCVFVYVNVCECLLTRLFGDMLFELWGLGLGPHEKILTSSNFPVKVYFDIGFKKVSTTQNVS